jgi:putative transposase
MIFNADIHHRQSIRLQGYDYSQVGAYFVTICVQHRECLFGNVVDDNMCMNDAGKMIQKWYVELENKFQDIKCGDFICMPNHIHFIVSNVGADLCVCPDDLCVCPDDLCVCPDGHTYPHEPNTSANRQGEHIGSPLPRVVQWFKTMTTNAYIDGVKNDQWPAFNQRLWQRNYYEHIVRNEADLNRIKKYIQTNPLLWKQDKLHPHWNNP